MMLYDIKEECGIFGIFDHKDAAALTVLGLHALQHRGQEGAGIITHNDNSFFNYRAFGHVGDHFNSKDVLDKLPGDFAVGHVRYSTAGGKDDKNFQPIFAELNIGGFAIAHNGNLTNAMHLRKKLINEGSIFSSSMDSEVIIHLVAKSDAPTISEKLVSALEKVEGAYSIIAMTRDEMIGIRDPRGVRPLSIGKINGKFVLASETCAFDIIGATFERDIEAGEMVIINSDGIRSFRPFKHTEKKFCIFEYIYFARPDSKIEGLHVYDVRKKIGKELARQSRVEADIVIPVPDSGVPAALGYAKEAGIDFELGIIRNHYVGRTFIEPSDSIRHLGVKLKHNANLNILDGKRVILVDDSIVRGTTSKKIIDMIRQAGAKEIHMRISSPPTTNPCFYGIDTPNKGQLLATKYDNEEMRKFIGADSLEFISIDNLYKAVIETFRDNNNPQYCDACFTGEYPISLKDFDNSADLPLLKPLFIDNSPK